MSELLKIIGSVIADFAEHLTGAKIKEFESEDPLSKNLLANHLCSANSKRIVCFIIPAVIVSVILAVMDITKLESDLRLSLMSLISLGAIAVGCGFISVVIYREYRKRKPDLKKLNRYVFLFWAVFSAAVLLMTVSDFSVNVFPYRFYFYLIIMTIFPLLNFKQSVWIILPFLALIIVFGVIFRGDGFVLFLAASFSLAYLIVSSLVYNSYCRLFISGRQLDTANERCRQINEKDSLTGLLNKKGLIRRLMDIIDRGTDKNIAAIFCGIDNFKHYNHTHTDTESDECLYNICNCVRIIAKSKTDIISRYGGDEFVIILQNISEYDLIYFAEQVRKNVETMALPIDESSNITLSVGVSQIVEGDFSDYSRLLKDAESSLSLAKNGGRNCVAYMGNVFKAS
ncbi:MAG: GGDEF domain-containing protein [Firmicutes bacterium]|nr:GGDEF domain-containing protein [[Eubacterium] siraeum]MCM1487220.1 GGDEF domain-containing protein [Bacillota bacterium]